jgi:hypothetical protein
MHFQGRRKRVPHPIQIPERKPDHKGEKIKKNTEGKHIIRKVSVQPPTESRINNNPKEKEANAKKTIIKYELYSTIG